MKKSTILGLSAALLCLSAGYAGIRQLPRKAQVAEELANRQNDLLASSEAKPKFRKLLRSAGVRANAPLVNEDFSRFTAGSETAPDALDLATTGEYQYIADSYTAQPGWSGAGVFQAGGCAYIGMYLYEGATAEDTGILNTPSMDLSGNNGVFTVRFRARVEGDVSIEQLNVVGVSEAADDYTDFADVMISNEWKEYEVTIADGTAKHYVQFYSYEYPIFIDDVVVEQVATDIASPVATFASDVTPEGFTANWQPVADATSYLLTVYSLAAQDSGVEETTVTEGFDGLVVSQKKHIDYDKSVFPDGWTISVDKEGTSRELYGTAGNYQSPSIALAFDATGDYVESPESPSDIKNVSFWTKNQNGDADCAVTVEGFDGNQWVGVGTVVPASVDKNGETVNVPVQAAGIKKIRLTYVKSAGNCSIDDVAYTYGGVKQEYSYLFQDKEVAETSCPVTGIEPDVEYYYYVKAKNEKFTSKPSNVISILDKEPQALAVPEMLPATNVTANGFTANWKAVEGADGYAFYTMIHHTAPAMEDYALFDTDFSGITEGTLEAPVEGEMFYYLDEVVNRSDWYAIFPVFANGKLGLSNAYADVMMGGMLASAYYDLTASAGKVDVDLRVMGQDVSAVVVSLCYDNEQEESVELSSETIVLGEGWNDYSVSLSGGTDKCYVAISCGEGMGTLFIDNLKVTQPLDAGESVVVPYFYEEPVENSCNVAVSGTQPGDRYCYFAAAFKLNADETELEAMTDYSEPYFVDMEGSVDGIREVGARVSATADGLSVENPAGGEVAVYGLNGVCLYRDDSGAERQYVCLEKGLYIVKVGGEAIKVVR